MRNFLRQPLTWVVLAECTVVVALVIVAWHLVANVPVSDIPLAVASPPADAGEGSEPAIPGTSKAKPRHSSPGLNVDPAFWRSRLNELNRGEAEFERLEWRLVRSATDAARRYLESVVLPLVRSSELLDRAPPR